MKVELVEEGELVDNGAMRYFVREVRFVTFLFLVDTVQQQYIV
jgi:hypothetical protein